MKKTKVKAALDYRITSLLFKNSVYWLTPGFVAYSLDETEKLCLEQLDWLTEHGLVERLELSLTWFRITSFGSQRLVEFRVACGG